MGTFNSRFMLNRTVDLNLGPLVLKATVPQPVWPVCWSKKLARMLTKSCLNNIHSCFCLRPKAKELGIAQVVVFLVVGFFVSKTHATPLSLYFYFFFLFILSITISIYHYIIHVYLPRPTYLPTYTNLCQPTYPYQHTYLPISTHLPTDVFLWTHTNPLLSKLKKFNG